MPVSLESILAAHDRIAGAVYRSPCPYSLSLSRLCGAEVFCKLDHLQMTGSFKERGARNKLMLLTDPQRKAGVIAASAGNHALGLAYHGRELGVPVTVVMPKWAPLVKVTNCRAFGANVILHGDSYDSARAHARHLADVSGLTYIHGFDDPDIIAGQGTMGLEILEDVPDVDAVIVPVGGGGLIAGVGTAVKALKPHVKVIGVEPANAPTLHESLKAGHPVRIEAKPTLADGLAVAEAGQLCVQIARQVVDHILLVDEPTIALAVLRLLELEKAVVEGAGAVTLAAAMDKSMGLSGKRIVLCLCEGNIDMVTINRVIERGLAADGRLCRISAIVSERPGSLAKLLTAIADAGAGVKEVHHDRSFGPADVARAAVTCVLETRDPEHVDDVRRTLTSMGFEIK